MEKTRVAESIDGYKELKDGAPSKSEGSSSSIVGYLLTVALAMLGAGTSLVTGVASKAVALPRYTENFTRCLAASATMYAVCLVTRTRIVQDNATMRNSVWLAIADWFFLWGYVQCLADFDPTQYSAVSVSMTPILSVVLGFFILGESAGLLKLAGLIRNGAVVVHVIDPLGFFAKGHSPSSATNSSGSKMAAGCMWGLVACLGTVFMRIVQRRLTHVSSAMTSFWCFAINTVLWFPPGSIPPEVRLPFLWPTTPEDAIGFGEVPVLVWMCAAASGFFGATLIAGQAVALNYIDVGTYSNLIQPLSLVCSFLVDAITQPKPQLPRVVLGISVAVVGIAAEGCISAWMNRQSTKIAG